LDKRYSPDKSQRKSKQFKEEFMRLNKKYSSNKLEDLSCAKNNLNSLLGIEKKLDFDEAEISEEKAASQKENSDNDLTFQQNNKNNEDKLKYESPKVNKDFENSPKIPKISLQLDKHQSLLKSGYLSNSLVETDNEGNSSMNSNNKESDYGLSEITFNKKSNEIATIDYNTYISNITIGEGKFNTPQILKKPQKDKFYNFQSYNSNMDNTLNEEKFIRPSTAKYSKDEYSDYSDNSFNNSINFSTRNILKTETNDKDKKIDSFMNTNNDLNFNTNITYQSEFNTNQNYFSTYARNNPK
jgi:hypothetical protein